jgi:osmotically-inducible protein OsmY
VAPLDEGTLARAGFRGHFIAVHWNFWTSETSILPRYCAAASLPFGLVLTALNACSTIDLAIGGGATAGVAASEERGIGGSLSDAQIATQISGLWANKSADVYIALGLSVYEGRVLITGVLKTQEQVDTAVADAWRVKGVREVINEVIVDPSGRTGTFASDTFIVAQLRAQILVDKDVSA